MLKKKYFERKKVLLNFLGGGKAIYFIKKRMFFYGNFSKYFDKQLKLS